jgi:hypothetical protein
VSNEMGNNSSKHANITAIILINKKILTKELKLKEKDIAKPKKEECDRVSPKDDIRRQITKEPKGPVIKANKTPATHPGKIDSNIY